MGYTIQKDGDYYEVRYWPFLKNIFPNYETFWKHYIVPLTRRAEGKGIHLKPNIDPLLESMAMSHYSIYYHLGVSLELQSKLVMEFPEEIFYHISASSEMVERFVLIMAKLLSECKDVNLIDPITEEDFQVIVDEYWTKTYKTHFDRFQLKGQSINITLQNFDDIFHSFWEELGEQAENEYKSWRKVVTEIRHYRNVLSHNPKLGTLHFDDGFSYVPIESKLHKYELWSSIFQATNKSDFIQLRNLLSEFQSQFIDITNNLWTHTIDFFEEISKSDAYISLAGNGEDNKNGTVAIIDPDNTQETTHFTMTSGSSSYDPTWDSSE